MIGTHTRTHSHIHTHIRTNTLSLSLSLTHTHVLKSVLTKIEHIELQAKLLNSFLRSNKSNINQVEHNQKCDGGDKPPLFPKIQHDGSMRKCTH